MFNSIWQIATVAWLATVAVGSFNAAHAQCSGGGRGGASPSASTSPLTLDTAATSAASLVNQRQAAYAQQQMLAMQQQRMLQQQQIYAMHLQRMHEMAMQQEAQQAIVRANRIASAEAKRAKREQRIAEMKSQRGINTYGDVAKGASL